MWSGGLGRLDHASLPSAGAPIGVVGIFPIGTSDAAAIPIRVRPHPYVRRLAVDNRPLPPKTCAVAASPKGKPGASAPPSPSEAMGAEGGLRVGVGGRCNQKHPRTSTPDPSLSPRRPGPYRLGFRGVGRKLPESARSRRGSVSPRSLRVRVERPTESSSVGWKARRVSAGSARPPVAR